MINMKGDIEKLFLDSAEEIKKSSNLSGIIEKVIIEIINFIEKGNKVIIFGNGGSAADAQHIAAELISKFKKNRKSLPAIALTTDTSILTSIGNDFSFDFIFSRQCESLVSKGDVVIGISTSGNSINVKNGIIKSKEKEAKTIALLGNNGGIIKEYSDMSIIVESSSTSKIQEVHRVIYHIICEFVESKFA
jgi:D-sedoheptulose 7-phosphate isomerase